MRVFLTFLSVGAIALAQQGPALATGPDRGTGLATATTVGADPVGAQAVPTGSVTVAPAADGSGWVLVDSLGREVTLRGFNVSGSTKLVENGLLPFRSRADAARSAQAMRDLTGANVVRFLISWAGVQPAPDTIDTGYLDRVVAQVTEFTSRGIAVLLDFHQDLWSAYLFDQDSWYTGDGAPRWVIDAGGYPDEFCGICLTWGQNMLTNEAVRDAAYDFWHNRQLSTSVGTVGVQDAYLAQAGAALRYLTQHLAASDLARVVGVDPLNEPFDGGLSGASGTTWEQQYLLPFYQRFRAQMDAAGWTAKPAFVEPLVFWNTGFLEQGGLSTIGSLGARYVFNSHYYDGARMTVDPTPAGDGTYAAAMNRIRSRGRELGTAPFVSEFGNRMSGLGSDRTPWMVRSMYQGMDAGVAGANWWRDAAGTGGVLSAAQWHWDVYSGRHHELMNGNPDKVLTTGDAWNDEDFSVIVADDAGAVSTRLDPRVLDRLYPTAVAGRTLAFGYEDLARSGFAGAGQQRAWLTVPSTLPTVAALTGGRQFGVLVWRQPATTPAAPTELHLPASFAPATTAVVGDLAAQLGVSTSGPVTVGLEPGSASARRLLVDAAGSAPGTLHVLLVVNAGSGAAVTAAQLSAARAELAGWASATFPPV